MLNFHDAIDTMEMLSKSNFRFRLFLLLRFFFFCENGIIIPGDESMIDHSNGIRVEWNRIESRVNWEKEYSNIFEFIGKLGSRVELFSTRDFVKACW